MSSLAKPLHDKDCNHHSLRDTLGDLDTISPDCALTSCGYRLSRNQESVRRLSASLQSLMSQQHGMKHLPELPIPTYDNGNIDLTASTRPTRATLKVKDDQKPKPEPNTRPLAPAESPFKLPRPRTNSLGSRKSVRILTLRSLASDLGKVSSSARHGRCDSEGSPRASFHHTRTASAHRTSTDTETSIRDQRPRTSDSSMGIRTTRKTSLGYEDQRYVPVVSRESSEFIRGSPGPRNRIRLAASFKDLKAEKRLRNEDSVSRPPVPEQNCSMSVMSLNEALRGGLSPLQPLHDPHQDRLFTAECARILSSNVVPFQHPHTTSSRPAERVPDDRQRIHQEARDRPQKLVDRGRTCSDATSISTSILDLFPEPEKYRTLQGVPYAGNDSTKGGDIDIRPDSQVLGEDERNVRLSGRQAKLLYLDDISKSSTSTSPRKSTTQIAALSKPPKQPLPQLPQDKTRSRSAQASGTRRSYDSTSRRSSKNRATLPTPISLPTDPLSFNSRIQELAASKNLHIDPNVARNLEVNQDAKNSRSVDLRPFLSRAYLNSTDRDARVRDVKKKHLSTLSQDVAGPKYLDAVASARPGCASEVTQSSCTSIRTKKSPTHQKSSSVGKDRAVPAIPVTKIHARATSDIGSIRAGTGSSQSETALRAGAKLKRGSKRLSNSQLLIPTQPLRQSELMVVVDTDPQVSHGFHAGGLSPANSLRKEPKGSASPDRRFQRHERGSSDESSGENRRSMSRSNSSDEGSDDTDITSFSDSDVRTSFRSSNQSLHNGKVPYNTPDTIVTEQLLIATLNPDRLCDLKRQPIATVSSSRTNASVAYSRGRPSHGGNDVDLAKGTSDGSALRTKKEEASVDVCTQAEFRRLNHELKEMGRVYTLMNQERQSLRPFSATPKSSAEFSEDDGRGGIDSQQKLNEQQYPSIPQSTRPTPAKIEAGIARALYSVDSDSDATVKPSRSMSKRYVNNTPRWPNFLNTRKSTSSNTDTEHLLAQSPTMSTHSKGRLSIPAGSTLPFISKDVPASSTGPSAFPSEKKHRYSASIASIYNRFSPPKKLRKTSLSAPVHRRTRSYAKPLSVEEKLSIRPEKLVNLCQDSELRLEMNLFSSSTKQMDRAIDDFVTSDVPNLHSAAASTVATAKSEYKSEPERAEGAMTQPISAYLMMTNRVWDNECWPLR